jgi:shikimate dehydrogenase
MPPSTAFARACVIGHPVAHSRSPLIHGYWLRSLGLAGEYSREDVAPADFASFFRSLQTRGYRGANVTLPHKEAAFRLVDAVTDRAAAVEAVNTVWFDGDRLVGDNTDGFGFLANLDAGWPGWGQGARTAIVLGAGGAARGIVAALKSSGIGEILIANRTRSRADELAARSGAGVVAIGWDDLPEVLGRADLLVNTTSLGMTGHAPLEIALDPLKPGALVTDIVYVPLVTGFLQQAAARGHPIVDGLGMLLHQAVPGFEHWFGVRPEVSPDLRRLVEDDILDHKT